MSAGNFNILIVGQAGRLSYEALIFAASLRAKSPGFKGRLIVAEPAHGGQWPDDPRMSAPMRAALTDLGAEIRPFMAAHFGASYPQGNKIEALSVLPEAEPFVFFDTDTLFTGDISEVGFDFDRPSASMRREGTWPVEELYWPGYTAIWRSLYDRYGLDFDASLDLSQPDEYWERYMYFNAGWFFYRDPKAFHNHFLRYAVEIRDNPTAEMVIQPLHPWLDQVALPLVISALGGGRPGAELDGLDGDVTCHYRMLPLLYARESDAVVQTLEEVAAPASIREILMEHEPAKRMIYDGQGAKVRALFDRDNLPAREQKIRATIKRKGYWMR